MKTVKTAYFQEWLDSLEIIYRVDQVASSYGTIQRLALSVKPNKTFLVELDCEILYDGEDIEEAVLIFNRILKR